MTTNMQFRFNWSLVFDNFSSDGWMVGKEEKLIRKVPQLQIKLKLKLSLATKLAAASAMLAQLSIIINYNSRRMQTLVLLLLPLLVYSNSLHDTTEEFDFNINRDYVLFKNELFR